jgi:hypothetical protein
MIRWPDKLGGTHRLVRWLNRVVDAGRSAEIKAAIGARLIESSDGKTLVVDFPNPTARKHPFQIYRMRDGTPAASDWRKFRIYAGYVSVDFAAPVLVTGTDGDATPASILADDATAKFWFWVDLSTPATPTIGSGADPQTWSASKLPIGYVNTQTEYAATVGLQMITSNIFACP